MLGGKVQGLEAGLDQTAWWSFGFCAEGKYKSQKCDEKSRAQELKKKHQNIHNIGVKLTMISNIHLNICLRYYDF